jgi:hypothetical protein
MDVALQTIQQQVQQIQELNARLGNLESKQQVRDNELTMYDELRDDVPSHLAYARIPQGERKKILNSYAKVADLPQPLQDGNGLATRGIQNKFVKQVISTHYCKAQREALDVLKVATSALIQLKSNVQIDVGKILRDIVAITVDNAQSLAKQQLQLSLEARSQKASESLLSEEKIDVSDTNIIQERHVLAMSELYKFKLNVDKSSGGRTFYKRGSSSNYRGGSYRGRYRNNYRSQGFRGRSRGRGRGGGNAGNNNNADGANP